MKLYNSGGPNPRMVRMFMAEKGFDVPKVDVDLRGGENRCEPYLKVNPSGQTPALELDDGTVLAEITAICEYVGGSLEEPLIVGPIVLDAVLFRLMVIGEAAKHISSERLEGAPDIRWRDIAGLRDVIAHEYFRIQKQIIEDTVRRDLPQLLRALRDLA